MASIYNREIELQKKLNKFLSSYFGIEEKDYYSILDEAGFLKLKAVLSDINNILTMKVTFSFIDWLSQNLNLEKSDSSQMIETVLKTKPNSNGYDIELKVPIEVIAEVKCNIPINKGTVYGAAQRNGIIKDLNALSEGKSKSAIDPERYLKFMVFLDTPEIKMATRHLVKNMKNSIGIIEASSVDHFDINQIYIVYVDFNT